MSASVEIYDPRLGKWMYGNPMNKSRGYLVAAVLNGSIYVIGGVSSREDIIETVCIPFLHCLLLLLGLCNDKLHLELIPKM